MDFITALILEHIKEIGVGRVFVVCMDGTCKGAFVLIQKVGLLVDSEIVLSTRYGKTMVFINKNLINRDLLPTWLIRGKVGPGMWCVKFNITSNVLVCVTKSGEIQESPALWYTAAQGTLIFG